jgi:hypothetical protein
MVSHSHISLSLKGTKHWFQNPWFLWFLAYRDPASAAIDIAHIKYLQLYRKMK